jgi:hypothetical protein
MGGFLNPYSTTGEVTLDEPEEIKRRKEERDLESARKRAELRTELEYVDPRWGRVAPWRKAQIETELAAEPGPGDIALNDLANVPAAATSSRVAGPLPGLGRSAGPLRAGPDTRPPGWSPPNFLQARQGPPEAQAPPPPAPPPERSIEDLRRDFGFKWGANVPLGAGGRPIAPKEIRDPLSSAAPIKDRSNIGSGGTLSYAGGPGSEAHINYLRNSGQLADYMREQAQIAQMTELAKDPLYLEKARAKFETEQFGARAEAAQRAEQNVRREVLARKADIDADYDESMADLDRRKKAKAITPEQETQALQYIESKKRRGYQQNGIPLSDDASMFGRIG